MGGCASTPGTHATISTPKKIHRVQASTVTPHKKHVVARTPPRQPAPRQLKNLLPAQLKDKQAWATDIRSAFTALQIPPNTQNFCAVIAIIAQESSFQADPIVPGLPAIVRREIAHRSAKYNIPTRVTNWILSTTSADGRSYKKRIRVLKTEKQLSDLIEEIIARVPAGEKLFANYNPIHTGGPMQVSVKFAENLVRVRPYPYTIHGNLRNEVFSRHGGIYFGSAILLDYPAPYNNKLYLFADFNAGRYSSRNAAFQLALSRLSRKTLATDGDLLRYQGSNISKNPSATLLALLSIKKKLRMGEANIKRDLQLEKLARFSKTQLYNRLFALADRTGRKPREILPGIQLKSPKIHRKLTTRWFAQRVYHRYQQCIQQKN